jgi:hypothetical protein
MEIRLTLFVDLITTIEYRERMHDVFSMIFENYVYNNILENKKFKLLNFIIFDFIELILNSINGDFQIINNKVYLFEDKRFFIPFEFMREEELKIIKDLIKHDISLYKRETKIFESKPIKFKICENAKLKLLYSL